MKLYIDLSTGAVVMKPLFLPKPALLDVQRSSDRERFNGMVGRLRARQLEGDDLAGRVLWVLSRGPIRLGVEYSRELVHEEGKREFSLGLPRVVAAWGNG